MKTEVRVYSRLRKMKADIRDMERRGWRVQETQVMSEPRRWSCCLGFIPALFFGRRRTWHVIFQREAT